MNISFKTIENNKALWIGKDFCEELLETTLSFFELLDPLIFEFISTQEEDVSPSDVMTWDEYARYRIGRPLGISYNPPPQTKEELEEKKKDIRELIDLISNIKEIDTEDDE